MLTDYSLQIGNKNDVCKKRWLSQSYLKTLTICLPFPCTYSSMFKHVNQLI